MSRSSMPYMKRKKTVLSRLYPAPWFATRTLSTHKRPHVALPVLRDKENPSNKLAEVPLSEVPAHVRREDTC